MNRIEPSTLSVPIDGLRLRGATLGAQIAVPAESGQTLLCFLRHFGCIFCREMVRDLKWADTNDAGFPAVVLVGQGSVEETHAFIDPMWPDVPVICDPERTLYRAMGLGRGSIYQMFGPSVWACGVRAASKGNFVGKFVGDPWTMPGAFLLDRVGQILWRHEFRHQGDHPEWSTIARFAAPADAPLDTPLNADPVALA